MTLVIHVEVVKVCFGDCRLVNLQHTLLSSRGLFAEITVLSMGVFVVFGIMKGTNFDRLRV